MWKCDNCLEEGIKDKYKHCWNCGTPRPTEPKPLEPKLSEAKPTAPTPAEPTPTVSKPPIPEIAAPKRVVRDVPKIIEDVPLKSKTKTPPTTPPLKPEPIIEKPEIIAEPAPAEKPEVIEDKPAAKPVYEDNFLSAYDSKIVEAAPSSPISIIIPVLLWLIAFGAVAGFAYYSNQKTNAFDQQILADAKNFQAQDQYKFPEASLPTRRNQAIVEGNIKGKVLPLNRQNGELNELYYELPDDLRPANPDEAKTLMYLDCKAEPAGRLADGSPGYQEKCNTYLVERETSKIIGVQDFLGISPALSQQSGNGGTTGKVPKDRYLSYLREKQLEADRSAMKHPSDSPNHHYLTKSEFVYAIILLCVLAAIGLGWAVYKIKSAWTAA